MAPRATVRAPTTSSIPSSYKIPSTTRSLVKSLSRLSRNSLITLAIDWLQDGSQPTCAPYLSGNRDAEEEAEEDYLHTPADTIEELRTFYADLRNEAGPKRDIVDRILDGDWRRGITLQQLAMIDFQHLQDQPASLRWTALKLVPLTSASREAPDLLKPARKPQSTEQFPRIQPSTFLRSLQHEISPLVKAHYYLHRLSSPHHLTILRLYVADTPYAAPVPATQANFTDSARTLYLAFPDSCPYIYVALSGSGGGGNGSNISVMPKIDVTALKRTVLEALPKAFSRPQQRYALETTSLTAKNLSTMRALRGNGTSGASQGAYSIFADAVVDEGPLDVMRTVFVKKMTTKDEKGDAVQTEEQIGGSRKRKVLEERDLNIPAKDLEGGKQAKKRKIEAARRFGTTGLSNAKMKAPIDRLHIKLEADLVRPRTADARARSNTDLQQPDTEPTIPSRTTRSKKGSVLDTFDPQKRQQQPQSSSYLAAVSASRSETPTASAPLTLTFSGTDVFAGLRKLAEAGFVDLDSMPAWMTGEEGVSNAVVTRDGVVVGGMGGGA